LTPEHTRRLSLKTQIVTLIVIFAQVAGNTLLDYGVKRFPKGISFAPMAMVRTIFSPGVLFGISLLVVWLFARMALLSWADLSYVLPMTSIGYALTALAGKVFFKEQISPQRWAGILLIVLGMTLVGLTRPRTTASNEAKMTQPAEAVLEEV